MQNFMTVFSYFFSVADTKKFDFLKKEGFSKYFPTQKCHLPLHLTIPSNTKFFWFCFLVNFQSSNS